MVEIIDANGHNYSVIVLIDQLHNFPTRGEHFSRYFRKRKRWCFGSPNAPLPNSFIEAAATPNVSVPVCVAGVLDVF